MAWGFLLFVGRAKRQCDWFAKVAPLLNDLFVNASTELFVVAAMFPKIPQVFSHL